MMVENTTPKESVKEHLTGLLSTSLFAMYETT